MFKKLLLFMVTLFCVLSVSISVFAFVPDTTSVYSIKDNGVYKGAEKICDITDESGNETADYTEFKTIILDSFEKDLRNGFAKYTNLRRPGDHVELEVWGEFLYTYYDKVVSEMPFSAPEIPLGIVDASATVDNTNVNQQGEKEKVVETIKLGSDRGTKSWLMNFLKDELPSRAAIVNRDEVCNVYTVKFDGAVKLSDFNVADYSDYNLAYTLHPFTGKFNDDEQVVIGVHSIGNAFGMQLNTEYMNIVASSANNKLFKRVNRIDGKVSCVQGATFIGMPSIIRGKADELKLADFKSLDAPMGTFGVDLEHKSLFNYSTLIRDSVEPFKEFSEYGLNSEDLIVVCLTDGLCVVPTKYLEIFTFDGTDYKLGNTIDITPFFNGEDEVELDNGAKLKFDDYVNADSESLKISRTEMGNFVLYCAEGKTPYIRILNWVKDGNASKVMSSETEKELVDIIYQRLSSEGKTAEFEAVYGQYKKFSFTPIIAVGIILILIIALVVFFVKKKKKNQIPAVESVIPMNDPEYDNVQAVERGVSLQDRGAGVSFGSQNYGVPESETFGTNNDGTATSFEIANSDDSAFNAIDLDDEF